MNEILSFLRKIILIRFQLNELKETESFPDFVIEKSDLSLAKWIANHELSWNEIVILFLALTPHLNPSFFTSIIQENFPEGGDFPEFGGVKGKNHRGLIPTGETALFILAGTDIEKRLEVMKYFEEDHLFAQKGVLKVENPEPGEPKMSGRLIMEEEYVSLFTTGKMAKPKLGIDFPAERVTTAMVWEDLILPDSTREEIQEIHTWLQYHKTLLKDWELEGKIKPGFRVLFYGPPGTGKTLTATLLGNATQCDVYRIDLSMVVSKYIGETEKNLSKLFDKAADKNWILFFDEADSIFGKRTQVRDAHDKYANQEVSYLLQRIESHSGLVILASNLKTNIDSAFSRRFNLMVEFKSPNRVERLKLWKGYLPENILLDKDVNLNEIARNFELSGAAILNVVQRIGLQTLAKNNPLVSRETILEAIRKEYKKKGRMIT